MDWTLKKEEAHRLIWERSDGYARIVARETARGTWAVVLDRLEQAPEGPTYHHETVQRRENAVDLAAEWRNNE